MIVVEPLFLHSRSDFNKKAVIMIREGLNKIDENYR